MEVSAILLTSGHACAGFCPHGQVSPASSVLDGARPTKSQALRASTLSVGAGVGPGEAFSRTTAKGSGLCTYLQMAGKSSPSFMSYTFLDHDLRPYLDTLFCWINVAQTDLDS